MSFAGGAYFTNKGKVLHAKAIAGATLNFTRLSMGNGELGGQNISELTAMISEKVSVAITSLKTLTGGKATVKGVMSNEGLATGFYWRELGLFATDPDEGEILYCYGNAAALAEYIPAGSGSEILEKVIGIAAIVSDVTSISATIDESLVYALQTDLGDLAGTGRTTETVKGNADNITALGTGKISHSLATAVNDFLVASAAGVFIKKTLAEVKTILGLGSAAYTASTAYATAAQGTNADSTATTVTAHLADYTHQYGAETGAADAYAVTLVPAPTAYAAGMLVIFKATNANTGASTINVNGLGVKTIKKSVSVDLAIGDISAGQIVNVIYDGTYFQLVPMTPGIQIAKGKFSDTSTWVQATPTDYTKTIPLGFNAKKGRLAIQGYHVFGIMAMFTTAQADAISYSRESSSPGILSNSHRSMYGTVTAPLLDSAGGNIAIKNIYISGSDLIIVFHNIDATGHCLNILQCNWEVEG